MASHPADVEKYRQRFECDDHWKFRRDFILRHYGCFAENRLLCLSQVFVNVKLLGCRYPEPVMRRIEELSKDIEQPEKKQVAKFRAVSFVKASGLECSDPQAKQSYQEAPSVDTAPVGRAGIGRRKRSREHGVFLGSDPPAKIGKRTPTEEPPSPEIQALLAKFQRFGSLARTGDVPGASILEKVHEASQKSKMKLSFDILATTPLGYKCSVFLDGVLLAEGMAQCKKDSRHRAYEAAWEKVKKRRHKIVANPAAGGRFELHAEEDLDFAQWMQSSFVPDSTLQRTLDVKSSLPNFVLLLSGNWKEYASNTLFLSASLNNVSCKYDFTSDGPSSINCTVLLNGFEVGKGTGESRRAAKYDASMESLNLLRTIVPTVHIKTPVDCVGEELTKEMMGGVEKSATIPEDNVGHRLLTMMGWCGGGIGKDGTGIVDPILPKESVRRAGLGFNRDGKLGQAFKKHVKAVLKGFASKVVLKDLVFAPEFDNEERKFIHESARHLGLKSLSRNGPEGRFLTVRHKLSPKRLLEEVLRLGSTDKYEVVMPAGAAL